MRRSGDEEKLSELRARRLLELVFGSGVIRVRTTGAASTVDYRSTKGPARGIEVKEITVQEYRDLTRAYADQERAFSSKLLTGRWTVLLERLSLSSKLPPVPRFPPDDARTNTSLEARGFRVMTPSERENDWRRRHPGPKQVQTVRLKHLGGDIEAPLVVLESHGIGSTRDRVPFDPTLPPAVREALEMIAVRTGGAVCERHEPVPGQQPGVDIALVMGYVRTERADTLAERIQLWLDSDHSTNLRESLANEAFGVERHAVLVFDAATEPEHQSAVDQGLRFCPTIDLTLPDEIDVLWFIIGPVACRYQPGAGWQTVAGPLTA